MIALLLITALSCTGTVCAETVANNYIAADEIPADVTASQSTADGWIYYVKNDADYYNQYTNAAESKVIVITGYNGDEEVVTVPAEIDGVKVEAIESIRNDRIREVTVSKGILRIDDFAFSGCTELRKVICRDTVQYVGKYAFQNCTDLSDFYATGKIMYIDSFAFSDTAVKVVRLPKDYYFEEGAFPHNTTKTTGWLEYWQMRIFRILPYEMYNFSVPIFVVIELIILFVILYYLKQFLDFVLSKTGLTTQYDYRVYCKKNRECLISDTADQSGYHYRKPNKKSPILYYSFVILLIVIVILSFLSAVMLFTDVLFEGLRESLPAIVRVLIDAAFTIFAAIVTGIVVFKIYKAYRIRSDARAENYKVKKYQKGDKRFDS